VNSEVNTLAYTKDYAQMFEAFTAVFQVEVFCVVTLCSFVVGYQCFRGPYCSIFTRKNSTWISHWYQHLENEYGCSL